MTSEENKANYNDIGSQLRQAREARGLSISAAALQSTLDVAIIEKLEENRFSEVGAPVFTRGYLNLYARNLGLNEQKINEEFNNLKADPTPKLRITEANAASQNKPFKRKNTGTWIFIIAMLVLCALLLQQALDSKSWLVTQINRTFNSDSSGKNNVNNESEIVLAVNGEPIKSTTAGARNSTTDAASTENNTRPLPSETNNTNQIITGSGNTTTTTVNDDSVGSQITSAPAETSSENNDLTLVSLESDNNNAPTLTISEDGNDNAAAETSTTADSVVATGGTLHFHNESWIQVNDANGKVVKIATLKKGETIDLPASGAPYKLNIGRPNNVTLTIGAEEKPLKNYQQGNSERRFTVDIPNG